tara:strand:+ start:395 stop:1204 length:810 start_codon:yes stop_codon:yes gene_type:complete
MFGSSDSDASEQAGMDASSKTNVGKMSVDFLTDQDASEKAGMDASEKAGMDASSETAGTGADTDIDRLIPFDKWKEEYLQFRRGVSEEMKEKINLHADSIKYLLWGCVDDVETMICENRTTESFSLLHLSKLVYHLSESVRMLGKESCLCDLLKKTQKAYQTIEWDENVRMKTFHEMSVRVADLLKKIQGEKERGTYVKKISDIKDVKRNQAKRQRIGDLGDAHLPIPPFKGKPHYTPRAWCLLLWRKCSSNSTASRCSRVACRFENMV